MAEHIVAVYETERAAMAAEQSVLSAGIPQSAIRRYAADRTDQKQVTPSENTTTHASGGGFWAWLFGEETTSETTHSRYAPEAYDRAAGAGNVVLSVTVEDDAKIHQAIAALEAHDPVDIDERSDEGSAGMAASTRSPMAGSSSMGRNFSSGEVAQAGTTETRVPPGSNGVAEASVAPVVSGSPSATSDFPERTSPATSPTATTMSEIPPGSGQKGEEVLALSEEQLEIGKRTVDRGTTRVRRYVVEKPVEETVALRDERVTVERRRPLESTGAPGAAAFEERVVEVRETTEEPVVAKTARVVEEVVVGREASERTETVKDTVRREDVEVSKNRE